MAKNDIVKARKTDIEQVQYQEWTDKDAKKAKADYDSETGSVLITKLGVGTHKFRFLPKPKGAEWGEGSNPEYRAWVHCVKTVDDKSMFFQCLFKGQPADKRKPCPVCNHAAKMQRSRNPVDQDEARQMLPTLYSFFNVVDRKSPDSVRVLQLKGKTYQEVQELREPSEDDDEIRGDFTNPTAKGFDVIIKRVGTGQFDTRYTVKGSSHKELGDMSLIGQQHDPRVFAKILPASILEKLVEGIDFDELKSLLKTAARKGMKKRDDDDDSDDDDDDDEPVAKKKKPAKRPVDDDEDEIEDVELDDDDDLDEEDDDDEPPPPKKKAAAKPAKKPAKRPVDDDDDDDDEGFDDEGFDDDDD